MMKPSPPNSAVGRREGDLGLAAAASVREHRGEQRFAGDEALAGADQLVHEAATAAGLAVTEDGFHVDDGVLVHHGASLGDR
jgi:hypothetical protein